MTTPYPLTRAGFDAAVVQLDAHLAKIKPRKLDGLDATALAAVYRQATNDYWAFRHFESFEAHSFLPGCWHLKPGNDVDNARRRANRARKQADQHLADMTQRLRGMGVEGLAAMKGLFLTGERLMLADFAQEAIDHFPDEAEPVFEMALARIARGEEPAWYQAFYERSLVTIRGYRARRADMTPSLGGGAAAGLAPALATVDRPPSDFPKDLFVAFAHHVFTGEMGRNQAAAAAWREVIDQHRLDPRHLEPVELAAFDDRHRFAIVEPISEVYGFPIPHGLAPYGFDYVDEDGTPVASRAITDAMNHVMRMTDREPYAPARAWRRR